MFCGKVNLGVEGMMTTRKNALKYRDLPWELKDQVDFTYGHIQKSQNPTIKHILERLKKYEKRYSEDGAEITAKENRNVIDRLESYIEGSSAGVS